MNGDALLAAMQRCSDAISLSGAGIRTRRPDIGTTTVTVASFSWGQRVELFELQLRRRQLAPHARELSSSWNAPRRGR